ncbi:hypothetical protein AB0I84_12380 [Streptomyces spectabilis]|uniref:hypothetical protein n=1 Tax=Streptomyces spectabilis TaxID=68270 RepID=UPI0033DA05BD
MPEPELTTHPAALIDQALNRLATPGTSPALLTLRRLGPLPVESLTCHVLQTDLDAVLVRMQKDGLVHERAAGLWTLSSGGHAATGVHRQLAAWHQRAFPSASTRPFTAHLNDALERLTRPGATRIIQQLAQHEQMPYTRLVEDTGLDAETASSQLRGLHRARLIDRTHRYGSVIALAPAGRTLGSAYDALATWQRAYPYPMEAAGHRHRVPPRLAPMPSRPPAPPAPAPAQPPRPRR